MVEHQVVAQRHFLKVAAPVADRSELWVSAQKKLVSNIARLVVIDILRAAE